MNRIKLISLSEEHIISFKEEMQEAFQHGFEAYNKDAEEIKFEKKIYLANGDERLAYQKKMI